MVQSFSDSNIFYSFKASILYINWLENVQKGNLQALNKIEFT